MEGLEVAYDGGHAGLSRIRAVAIRTSTIGGRHLGAARIAVFGVPVVGACGRIRIFNFIHHTCVWRSCRDFRIVRRHLGSTVYCSPLKLDASVR